MKKITVFSILLLVISCADYGKLNLIASLPKLIQEVSGNETIKGSDLIWMHNDSGNAAKLFGVSREGKIKKIVKVIAKNNDWEDLTSDEFGNLYIGDFGNNHSKRKRLTILKIKQQDLLTQATVFVEKIKFSYPINDVYFKEKKARYDAEAFFYLNENFYIFTKSRTKKDYGKTLLFKVPAKEGKHIATFISEFNFCHKADCRITAAAISPNTQKVVLLNHSSIFVFTNFKKDDFFSGDKEEIRLNFSSQKEGICFKDSTNLYITDEESINSKGNLYSYTLDDI
jgi:hypothetical protein